MVNNISKIKDTYQPITALVVYQRHTDGYISDNSLPQFFITRHNIHNDGTIGSGSPITEAFFRGLAESYSPIRYIHERVIAQSPSVIIWWRPASTVWLNFSKQTGIKSGRYPLPPMVFALKLNGKTIYNWALRNNERPKPTTKLYCSPLYNVYDDGRCCMGNAVAPGEPDVEAWESIFTGSACTNELPPSFKGGKPQEVWNRLRGKDVFPVVVLTDAGKTINSLITG